MATLFYPFNLTLWSNSSQFTQQGSSQQQQQGSQQQETGMGIPSVYQFPVNQTEYVNEAQIMNGYRAQNGYMYIIDAVLNPLWNVNISLAELPQNIQIPDLIKIAARQECPLCIE